MSRFFYAVWTATALAHIVFGAATAHLLNLARAPQPTLLAALLTVLLVAILPFRFRLQAHDKPISDVRRFFERLYFAHCFGTLVSTFFYVAAATISLAIHLITAFDAASVVRALSLPLVPTALLGFALGLYGTFYRAASARVTRITFPIKNLPSGLDGYTILQLSDLHVGSLVSKRRAARWMEMANNESPNLIALTGDYVTSGTQFHQEIANLLGTLRARDGVFAVLGNHDYFGADDLVSRLREVGIVVLRNERTTVRTPHEEPAALEIAGIDDSWTRNADVEKTMRDLIEPRPLLTLCHDPSLFPQIVRVLSEAEVPPSGSLVLSGHTHWGQMGVPFASKRFNLARRTFRFAAGLYGEGDSTLYVTAGLGTTGLPIRLSSVPEMVLFTLRPFLAPGGTQVSPLPRPAPPTPLAKRPSAASALLVSCAFCV